MWGSWLYLENAFDYTDLKLLFLEKLTSSEDIRNEKFC